ncbi:MAG: mechanosensitive ion channel, partial [Pyramidobacter sp.]|nr:mechanosensitive ion channel [Pyramidobacter sp.]
ETLLAVLKPLQEDSMILKKPEPWVCFANFGDSSLDFTLYFWINQRRIAGNRIESQVREDIVTAFDEAGISMAFPHLDVNMLRASAPLSVPASRDDDHSLQA